MTEDKRQKTGGRRQGRMTDNRRQKRRAGKCVMAFWGWIIEDGRLVYAEL